MSLEIWMPSDEKPERPKKMKRYSDTNQSQKARSRPSYGRKKGYNKTRASDYYNKSRASTRDESDYRGSERKSYRSGYNKSRTGSRQRTYGKEDTGARRSYDNAGIRYNKTRKYDKSSDESRKETYKRDKSYDKTRKSDYPREDVKRAEPRDEKDYQRKEKKQYPKSEKGLYSDLAVTVATGSGTLGALAGRAGDYMDYRSHENKMTRYKKKTEEWEAKKKAYDTEKAYHQEIKDDRKQREQERKDAWKAKQDKIYKANRSYLIQYIPESEWTGDANADLRKARKMEKNAKKINKKAEKEKNRKEFVEGREEARRQREQPRTVLWATSQESEKPHKEPTKLSTEE